MAIWVARAGKRGERENQALAENRSFIGWGEIGDLSSITTREEILELLERHHPDDSHKKALTNASQIYNFKQTMKVGDLFALPLKQRRVIAIGKVAGEYQYLSDNPEDSRHSRKIEWKDEIPRGKLDPDLQYSFGSALTVFSVKRNNAEQRILDIISGQKAEPSQISEVAEEDNSDNDPPDLEHLARQQIIDHIGRKFKGHRMEKLVSEVLRAQGFRVRENKRMGIDGGADILAGRGPMGFDEPLLCVQVKSSDSAIGTKEYNELRGVMQEFNAKHGLFVSWGGFKSNVEEKSRRDFFEIRLWNAEDLVSELQEVYAYFPKELQADLPMQQVWVLVDDG